jgi:phosphatidylglycerol---prolipoprotein diacylglyceryl transferase
VSLLLIQFLSPLALPFPSINPVAIEIGPVAVKWYGLAYMAGLLLGWLYIKRLLDTQTLWPSATAPFASVRADDLLLYMTVGVIIGGRLGSILFYEPGYYLQNLSEIPQVWKGGMAFHGALLGTGIAIWLFAHFNKVSPWSTMDLCAAAVPLGLFFGRLANFINSELWGRPTDVAWGMVFPNGGAATRHPSQLYEAALEGLLLFLVLRYLTHHRAALKSPGLVTGVFLTGYGLARSFCEFFRQPDVQHAFTTGPFTPGIVYSMPMIALGLWLIARARNATRVTA